MIQITALVENTSADPRLGAEHGLSLYIETGAHHILFDMGQTALYAANARALGVDLAGVDLAVLSHGHYDHGGGLAHFLAANPGAPVYLSRYAFEPHYHGSTKNIGLEPALAQNLRLRFTGETTPLGDGLTLYACNARPRRHDLGSFGLTTVRDGAFVAEDFRHEQYLLIEQAGKRVLISGLPQAALSLSTQERVSVREEQTKQSQLFIKRTASSRGMVPTSRQQSPTPP